MAIVTEVVPAATQVVVVATGKVVLELTTEEAATLLRVTELISGSSASWSSVSTVPSRRAHTDTIGRALLDAGVSIPDGHTFAPKTKRTLSTGSINFSDEPGLSV